MYHIGVATQHPPLPEHDQLGELGINFIKECLSVDPTTRPSAFELMDHVWMLDFRKALQTYDEAEMSKSPPAEMPSEEAYESATVARQAAIIQEKEVEAIKCISPDPPVESSLLGTQVYNSSDSNVRFMDSSVIEDGSRDFSDFPGVRVLVGFYRLSYHHNSISFLFLIHITYTQ